MLTVSHLGDLRAPVAPPLQSRLRAPFAGLTSCFAALSAALALVGLSSAPVYAGHWGSPVYTYSGSTVNVFPDHTETLDWAMEGGPRNGSASAYPGSSGSSTINGTIKTKWTWVADIGDSKADGPPPEIWVDENATADWNADGSSLSTTEGTHSLSIGGTVTINTDNDLNTSVTPYSKSGKLGKHDVHKIPVAGGVAEVSCTFKTECHGGDGPTEAQSTKRNTSMYTSVSYRVGIIATPYDFKPLRGYPQSDNVNGKLTFQYTWKSTTGNLSDLSDVLVYEHVDYPGATPWYLAPNPPFINTQYRNPTDYRLNGYAQAVREVGSEGTFSFGPDVHSHGPLDFSIGAFTATQEYRWHKQAIHGPIANGNFDVLKGTYGESHPIERKVETWIWPQYIFTVTKNGASATYIFQEQ